jgi:hypothetical protein
MNMPDNNTQSSENTALRQALKNQILWIDRLEVYGGPEKAFNQLTEIEQLMLSEEPTDVDESLAVLVKQRLDALQFLVTELIKTKEENTELREKIVELRAENNSFRMIL